MSTTKRLPPCHHERRQKLNKARAADMHDFSFDDAPPTTGADTARHKAPALALVHKEEERVLPVEEGPFAIMVKTYGRAA